MQYYAAISNNGARVSVRKAFPNLKPSSVRAVNAK